MKRILAATLILLMLFFSACSSNTPAPSESPDETVSPSPSEDGLSSRPADAPPLITVDGKGIPDDEIHYILSKTVEGYMMMYNGEIDWDSTVDGEPVAEFLRRCALEEIITSHVIYNQAAELGFAPDAEDLAYIDDAINTEIEMAGGRDAFDVMLESIGCSEDIFRFYQYIIPIVQGKLSMGLFLPGAPYAPAEEDLESLYASDFVNASYILIKKMDDNGNLFAGDELQSQRNIAEALYQRAVNGEDFTELVRKYTQDTMMEMFPEGFPLAKGSNGEEFDAALGALAEGGISSVTEAYDCFYIIKRLPPDPDWLSENLGEVEAHYEAVTYDQLVKEWRESAEVSILDEFTQFDIRSYMPKG